MDIQYNKTQILPYNAAKWNAQDAMEVKDAVNSKVDKVAGKSLIDDTEIARLSGVTNQDISGKANITDVYTKTQSDEKYLGSGTTLFSGDYDDLSNKPAIPSISGLASESWVTSKNYISGVTWNDVTSKPELFSGAYADLTGKPNLDIYLTGITYAQVSGKPTFSTVATSGAYTDLTGTPDLGTKENIGVAQSLIDALKAGNTTDTIASLKTLISAVQSDTDIVEGQISDLMALLNSDNTALDTIQEIVNYIEANRTSIDEVLVDKLDKSVYEGFLVSGTSFNSTQLNGVAEDVAASNWSIAKRDGTGSLTATSFIGGFNLGSATGALNPVLITQDSEHRFFSDAKELELNTFIGGLAATVATKLDISGSTSFISNSTDSFGSKVTNIVSCTQAEYDGITADNNTFYIII